MTEPVPQKTEESAVRGASRPPAWLTRAIIYVFVGVLSLSILAWVFVRLKGLLVLLLISLFISFALEPAVNKLESRGWRRGVATATMFLGLMVVTIGFGVAMGSVLIDQITRLVDLAPGYIEDVQSWIESRFGREIEVDELSEVFRQGGSINDIASRLADNLVNLSLALVTFAFNLLTVMLFTFYLVADGPRLRRTICAVLPPARQREVLWVWELAIEKTGGYIYSRALLSIASIAFHWMVFAVVGVPSPLALALWVGTVSQFVPVVGTYLAAVFPLLIALINNPIDAVWVLVAVVLYQQIENYLFAPRITAQTMQIHPAIAFGSVIAGASLLGPTGAVLALPAAATFQAIVSSYVQHHEVVESDLTAS